MNLTRKQQSFVLEYMIDKNATLAAKRCGYAENSAHVTGCRLLKNAKVAEYLRITVGEQQERLQIRADDILRELYKIMTVDIADLLDDDGTVKLLSKMPEAARKAISAIEIDEIWDGHGADKTVIGETKKIKLWNKVHSAELLGKHLKLWIEKMELSGKLTLEDLVVASFEEPETDKKKPKRKRKKG